jgi:hypothetical protein
MLISSQYTNGNANAVRSNGRRAHAAKARGVPTPAGTRLQMGRNTMGHHVLRELAVTCYGGRGGERRKKMGVKRAVENAAGDERIFVP